MAHTPIYSIVLAAGKGRRMRNNVIHKVCFQIGGVPAIHRALDVYNRLGVVRNVVVVGELAGQVVETVGKKFRNAVFAFQPDANGTGGAARCGMQALADIEGDARVLVVAGDKILDGAALSRLVSEYERTEADLGILVTPAEFGATSAGRVLFGPGDRPAAIVETRDIKLRACRAELVRLLESLTDDVALEAEVQAIVARHLGPSAKLRDVLGKTDDLSGSSRTALWDQLSGLPRDFSFGAERVISPQEANETPFRNESVYLVKKRVLEQGLENLRTNNAQEELYLTDAMIAILQAHDENGPRYRACYSVTQNPFEVMSYNNPEDLLRIEDHFHGQRQQSLKDLLGRLGPHKLRTVNEWLELFPADHSLAKKTRSGLTEFYGDDAALLAEKCTAYRQVLLTFGNNFGFDRHVFLVRSPGRINVMGRHIDWQGGRCNLMAVNQEVIMAVSPRGDDSIVARNVDPEQFSDVSISIGKLVSQLDWDNWLSVLNSGELVHHLRACEGSWNLYIEAAMLRLQIAYRNQLLRGMDIAVYGDVPVAAGMSSSSALVVATAESALALHGIEIPPQQFVNFCGEGEWFVGTRGGSADHAAMKYGAKGTINHVSFHDFELLEQIEFPDSHVLVVCNSFVQAKKAAGAKEAFNSRVGSYLIGVELVKKQFPQYAPFIRFVRDINPETLRVPPSKIYEILLQLPEAMTAHEVQATFHEVAESWSRLAPHFENAEAEAVYPVRGVLMFGICECARGIRAAECLRRKDTEAFGKLMNISHNGERRYITGSDGKTEPFAVDISDEAIRQLIEALSSQDPQRIELAQLHNQPGAYRCSTKEIDTIVDIACRTPGVAGAQIAGAGLGGCAMVLMRADCVPAVEQDLLEKYYEPNGLPSGVVRCTPSAGSCVVSLDAD